MKLALIAASLLVPAGLALAQKAPTNEKSTSTQSQQSTSSKTTDKTSDKSGTAGEVKTKTYKGELVDASCASGGNPTSSTKSSSQSAADRSSTNAKSSEQSGKTGEASRSGESSQSCAATSSTNEFALRMKDGSTVRFDAVGNERTKEAIAAKKKWSDALSSGKPIQVAVSGTESDNRLTVVSIH